MRSIKSAQFAAMWTRARATRWGLGTSVGTVLLVWFLLRVRTSHRPGWPLAWVWPNDWRWVAIHLVADVVTVILPVASVITVVGLEHDLLNRRRDLFAAYPTRAMTIMGSHGAVVAALDGGVVMMAVLLPWIRGWAMPPWIVLAMVLPSMLALGGLAAFVAELARSPWPGLLAAWAWAGASIAAMGYRVVPPLPLEVLFYTDSYSMTSVTWVNSAVTLVVALLLWGGAGWLMERARAQGRDAA